MGLKRRLEHFVPMMQVETGTEEDLNKLGYLSELKVDGSSAIAERTEDGFKLYGGRRGLEYTEILPEITEQLNKIPMLFRVDGEIVYIDSQGHMIFSGSQKRCMISSKEKVEKYKKLYPVGMYVWTITMLNGVDLTRRTYLERRKLLESFLYINSRLYNLSNIRLIPMSMNATEMYKKSIDAGYEGVVLKRIDGVYEAGKKSKNNIKVKCRDHTIYNCLPNNGVV